MKPLTDITVVSMDQAVAAPFCASRLADAGARVIKIERPGGDFSRAYDSVVNGLSAYEVWLNRGKESIELDVKDTGDAALLHRMIDRADVFLHNLAPGAAARAGFGADVLRARNPGLITCEISGYGDEGPYKEMKAYDTLIQAESGVTSITGTPEHMARCGLPICDVTAGMYALIGILEALHQRAKTGEGTAIQVALFDGLAEYMQVPLWHQTLGDKPFTRSGLDHPTIAPYGAFDCADGQVMIAVQNERDWVNLCTKVLGRPDMVDDPRFDAPGPRAANKAEMTAMIHEVFGKLPRADVMVRLTEAQIACSQVNDTADLAEHPQLRTTTGMTENGPVEFVASPMRFDGESQDFGPVPPLNAHGDSIRAEFAADAPKGEQAAE